MAKSEIFWNFVGSLWKGPRWFCLKEKLSGMVSYDVLKGFAFILVHLKTLFFDQLLFPRHMYGDFDILGSEHLGGSQYEPELDLELRER